jgi:hypothetical protein
MLYNYHSLRLYAIPCYSEVFEQSHSLLVERLQMGKLLDNLRKKHADDQSTSKRHSLNFLAHKGEITEALQEGWTTKQVWAQMTEDSMTTMSYSNFCRLTKKHITPSMNSADDAVSLAGTSPSLPSPEKSTKNITTKKDISPERTLTEKERLDLLRKEAFASVRSPKPTGSLIAKPKTREEENRELFGSP